MTPIFIKKKTVATTLFFTLVFAGGLGYGEYAKLTQDRKLDIASRQAAKTVNNVLQESTQNGMAAAKNVKKSNKTEFFVDYRLERDRTRSQQIELLREMVNNQNSSDEIRKEAQSRLLHITTELEKEMEIENLLRAKDFKDAVAFMQGETVTIVIQAKELSQHEIEKISDLVVKSTGVNKDNIVIVPKV